MVEYALQDESGKARPQVGYSIYYRSDGATVTAFKKAQSPRGLFRGKQIISLPAEKAWMMFDPETSLVFTRELGPDEVRFATLRHPHRVDSQEGCMGEVAAQLGPGKDRTCERAETPILGYSVWRARGRGGPAGRQIVFEAYLAPALDWLMLERVDLEGGSVLGRIVAVQVQEGRQDDSRFRVPRTARVSTQAEFIRTFSSFRGLPGCDECERRGEQADHLAKTIPPVY